MHRQIKVKLKIADIVIHIESIFPLEQFSEEEKKIQVSERFNNFFYEDTRKPDINIKIQIVDKLPEIKNTKPVFITYHFQDRKENWRLVKNGNSYIYKSPLEDKKQLMVANKSFDKIRAYLLPKKDKGYVWNTTDIIYDFLQVLLINYFAQRKEGIFTHSIGVKDVDGEGLLFAGKSGAGKSTTARLWYKHSKAMVLNDDRIIVRRAPSPHPLPYGEREREREKNFFIHGSPWHGEFSDYLASRIESAPLKKVFFVHHSHRNNVRRISEKEAFRLLYPALFPTFWDKKCLDNIASFCLDLVRNVPCYSMGFVNDREVIGFVRKIK